MIYLLGSIITPFSTNIGMFIVFRAVQACGGSSGQTMGAGVIADIFEVSDRGKAYGIFYIGPLLGPIIGPTVGGVLCEVFGWRSTFHFLSIYGVLLLVMVVFLLPETLRIKKHTTTENLEEESVLNQNEKETVRLQFLNNVQLLFLPILIMTKDPTVLLVTVYNTIVFSSIFFVVSV